jgi:hypothetical protein
MSLANRGRMVQKEWNRGARHTLNPVQATTDDGYRI